MLTLGLSSLLAAAAQPPDAGSDGSPPSSRRPVFYETTAVHARPPSSARGAVTTLDAAEAGRMLARSLGNVLADVPGLQVLSSAGRAGAPRRCWT